MVGAKGHQLKAFPVPEARSCSSSHWSLQQGKMLSYGATVWGGTKMWWVVLPFRRCLPGPEQVGWISELLLLSGASETWDCNKVLVPWATGLGAEVSPSLPRQFACSAANSEQVLA